MHFKTQSMEGAFKNYFTESTNADDMAVPKEEAHFLSFTPHKRRKDRDAYKG